MGVEVAVGEEEVGEETGMTVWDNGVGDDVGAKVAVRVFETVEGAALVGAEDLVVELRECPALDVRRGQRSDRPKLVTCNRVRTSALRSSRGRAGPAGGAAVTHE